MSIFVLTEGSAVGDRCLHKIHSIRGVAKTGREARNGERGGRSALVLPFAKGAHSACEVPPRWVGRKPAQMPVCEEVYPMQLC